MLTCPAELACRASICLREGRKEAGDVLRGDADARVCTRTKPLRVPAHVTFAACIH